MSAPARPAEPLTIDVSVLPDAAFGHRGLTWWATVAFMAIEASTLLACLGALVYLRTNTTQWPPAPYAPPDVAPFAANVVLLLGKLWPFGRAEAAAKRLDEAGVRRWMLIGTLWGLVCVVLRGFELAALDVRWDDDAYGSAVWAVSVAHTSLLVTDLLESAAITAIFFLTHPQPRHFSDVEDSALYERFLSISWAVLAAALVLAPRLP
ncbi:hypothetical protein [Roseisolibacter sp. H3M3-2]|uniref:hypothetical protein n=1 Tax=Roseisolibacter sp. H3M3-2 TaxID=3031323 RepID=UPI0023DBC3B0|nr:hypothetical protein [Roseisolibacter sp. H3M3-2]MDF1503465.1 hypothetical protein [Roseisolibacter sp. H3M3-2]